ncbi:acyl-CoA synthetase (AMP-forming)/AMP-acid ligase II/alkylation response protein AidB-like acyl-CoA dehydrogenase/acyl carrier protein [Massilia sp. UYP11]|uniref:AMP-binding protein n=1 Tax=Massilia sp. UYP11 TaxID=1756385 RepID=UPI003D1F2416
MAEGEPLQAALVLRQLERHARTAPERIAFTFLREDGREESLSNGELAARVDALAGLLAQEAAPGERALLLYPPGLAFVTAFFACLRAGLVAVPAQLPRRHEGERRLRALLLDADPALALAMHDAAPGLAFVMDGGRTRLLCVDGTQGVAAPPSARLPAQWPLQLPPIPPEALAFIQYTSGSTMAPRGVEVGHASLAANVEMIRAAFGFDADSVMVSWLPPFHDMGLVGSIVTPVSVGFRSVLMAPATFLRQPLRWLEAIHAYRATCAGAPDFAWDLCARRATLDDKARLDLSCLTVAYNGAEPVRAATVRRLFAAFAECGLRPGAMFPCYGLAEHTLLAAGGPRGRTPRTFALSQSRLEAGQVREADRDDRDDPDARELVSCGPPAPGVELLVVDPDSCRPAGPGRVGEIWLTGAAVARGYRNAPSVAQAAFEARLADGAGPWLRTGDLGFVRDGELYITGRLKDLVIVNGRNIYPQDVEMLVEEVAGFLEPNRCAVFGVDDGGQERLAIVLEADRRLLRIARRGRGDAASLAQIEALVGRIRSAVASRFGTTVDLLVLVRPGSFPRTSSGKVQRALCRALAARDELDVVYAARYPEREQYPRRRSADGGGPDAAGQSRRTADEMRHWLRRWAPRRLDSRLMDERRTMPPHVLLDLGNHGFLGMQAPVALGGKALATGDLLRLMEQLAAIDLTLATAVGVHNGLGLRPVLRFAPERLRAAVAPHLAGGRQLAAFALTEPAAGANPLAMRTRAQRCPGGWRLKGDKHLIGLANWAGWITVVARALDEQGMALGTVALLLPDDAPGLFHEAEALTMGMRAMVQNALRFDDVFVPDSHVLGQPGAGMEVARDAMAFARLGIGALCLGGMKRCAQLMLRYASRRDVAGGRLLEHPVTLARLEDLTGAIGALEALVRALGAYDDQGRGQRGLPQEACMACKCVASELLWEAADMLMQLLGGRGYLEPNLAPLLMRDARVMRILEGPTEALYVHLGAGALDGGCLAFAADVLDAPGGQEVVLQTRAALLKAGAACPSHAAGELCAWTLLVTACGDGPSAPWARRRWSALLAQLRQPGAQAAPAAVAARIAAYADAIGTPDQAEAGEDRARDPLLEPDRASGAREAAVPAPAPARLAAPAPDGPDDTRELVRRCLLYGLDGGIETLDDDQPFAEVGLDSLSAMPVALELERQTGMTINAELLYEYQTVAQLAAYLDARRAAGAAQEGAAQAGAAGG